MLFSDKNIPLKRVWGCNLVLSVLFNFVLCVITIVSENVTFFIVSYFVTILSYLILFDWRRLTLSLNIVGQVISFLSSFYLCYSPKVCKDSFKEIWEKNLLKWLFPLGCLHSICVSTGILSLKRKYNAQENSPLKDVVLLLTECDKYFGENKRLREQALRAKRLESEMKKKEIEKEEQVAKKIVDGLYSFTNRSNFPELEIKTDENVKDCVLNNQTNRLDTVDDANVCEYDLNKELGKDEILQIKLSIPSDLESLNSVRDKKDPYIGSN